MTIRRMEQKDIEQVAAIESACFSQPWSVDAFRDELTNPFGVTLVAEEKGEITGFINARAIGGEVYINNVAVKDGFRRRGIAEGMLLGLEGEVSGCEFITLEVRKSNNAAICLYEKCGYIKVGERKNFYEKPQEDAILMTKQFEKGERI